MGRWNGAQKEAKKIAKAAILFNPVGFAEVCLKQGVRQFVTFANLSAECGPIISGPSFLSFREIYPGKHRDIRSRGSLGAPRPRDSAEGCRETRQGCTNLLGRILGLSLDMRDRCVFKTVSKKNSKSAVHFDSRFPACECGPDGRSPCSTTAFKAEPVGSWQCARRLPNTLPH
jgi:hypothetical protein